VQAKPLTVLFVLPGPRFNLAEIFEVRALGLSRFARGTIITSAPKANSARFGEFDVQCVSSRRGRLMTFFRYVWTALGTARKEKRRGGLDLVVAYDPLKSAAVGYIVRCLFGAKLVIEVNGDYSDPANYCGIENKLYRTLKMRVSIATARFLLRRADGIKLLYPGQIIDKSLSFDSSIVRYFPNFTRTDLFLPAEHSNKLILTAGFPFYVKGMDIASAAFRKIQDKFPGWRLKVMGHHTDKREATEIIGGSPQIEVSRAAHYRDMPKEVAACSIFVLASRTEGIPRILLEAMSAGKPIIASRIGGIPNILDDGKEGYLFDVGDSEALAKHMEALMSDSELRSDLGSAARSRAVDEFSCERYFERLEEFYSEVAHA
jgi:glycosyltransferase involved in cell wall biosynthesis